MTNSKSYNHQGLQSTPITASAKKQTQSPHPTTPTTTPAASRTPRPVFLNAALSRVLQQRWRARLRSFRVIANFVLSDILWWLRRGVWYIVPTLWLARTRITIHLDPSRRAPFFDVYAASPDTHTLPALLQSSGTRSPRLTARLHRPVVLFVHGGAWGAGFGWQFSQLAHAVVQRAQASVVVLSYRLYPHAGVDEQADDVYKALQVIRERAAMTTPLVVMAHSSGAHITATAMLRAAKEGRPALADVALLSAGPFHLGHHWLFESRRGVAVVSPMQPAAYADDNMSNLIQASPSTTTETLEIGLYETSSPTSWSASYKCPAFLEGDMAATNVPLPPVTHFDSSKAAPFPRTFLFASSTDTIVPIYSSIRFAAALRRAGLHARLLVYDGVEHNAFVTHWFDDDAAAKTDLSDVLDVSEEDEMQRVECVRMLHGTQAASLVSPLERGRAKTAHIRDVLRILESLAVFS